MQISQRAFLAAGIGGIASTSAIAKTTSGRRLSGLDKVVSGAVARGDIPFAAAIVADRYGILRKGAVGKATAERQAALDTAFRLFSVTKAVGSLSATGVVDRRKISLDTPIASIFVAA